MPLFVLLLFRVDTSELNDTLHGIGLFTYLDPQVNHPDVSMPVANKWRLGDCELVFDGTGVISCAI